MVSPFLSLPPLQSVLNREPEGPSGSDHVPCPAPRHSFPSHLFFFLNWGIVALQCCVTFCCITIDMYVFIYSLPLDPPSRPPPPHPTPHSTELSSLCSTGAPHSYPFTHGSARVSPNSQAYPTPPHPFPHVGSLHLHSIPAL